MDILPKAGLRNKRNDLLSFRWGDHSFLAPARKEPKEAGIGAALCVLLPQSKPPAPMYPTRPHRHRFRSTLT